MVDNPQDYSFLDPLSPVSGEPLEGFGGRKAVLGLSMAASATVALFFTVHWTIALVGGAAVLVLSAMEIEAFLLFVIFLTPFVWVLEGDMLVRSVTVGLRSLVVIGFFAGRFLRGNAQVGQLFRPAVSRASLVFLCAAVAPTILGQGELTYESGRAIYQLVSFVAFYFVVLAWVDSRQRIRRVLLAVLFSTLVTAGFAVYQQLIGGYSALWVYLSPQDEYTPPWSGRSTSFMGHPNSLAGYLNLVLPLALSCCVLGKGKWRKLGGWTFGLGSVALFSTQSLGGLLAFLAVIVLAIFCYVRSSKKRLVLLAGICALAGMFYLFQPILNPAHTEEVLGSDATTRLLLWTTAWDEFVHSPMFGVGWGNFAAPYGFNIPTMPGVGEAHNIYLQLMAETGLVGLFAFLGLVVQAWRQARRQWRSSNDFLESALAFGVLGALLSLLVHGFLDVPLFTQSGTLLWMFLALLAASHRLHHESVGGGVRLPGAQA